MNNSFIFIWILNILLTGKASKGDIMEGNKNIWISYQTIQAVLESTRDVSTPEAADTNPFY